MAREPTAPMVIRTAARIRDAMREAADADGRSISALAGRIMEAWLREHGYLPPPAPKKGLLVTKPPARGKKRSKPAPVDG